MTAYVIRGAPTRQGKRVGPLFVSPGLRGDAFAFPGKKASTQLTITADDTPVKIARLEGATKYFASRVEVVEPGRSYRIVLESLPSDNSGTFKDRLLIVTDNPTLPVLPINVSLTIYPKP
ncbi:MAG TPA: hypothetical protein VN743_07690 [Blastocatellia bacterium]|nr:hypothetical protein [Blastocatellia bacterium]